MTIFLSTSRSRPILLEKWLFVVHNFPLKITNLFTLLYDTTGGMVT